MIFLGKGGLTSSGVPLTHLQPALFFVLFWGHPLRCSGITPGRLGGPSEVPRIELPSAACIPRCYWDACQHSFEKLLLYKDLLLFLNAISILWFTYLEV